MEVHTPNEILTITENKAVEKSNYPFSKQLLLGILGGAYIALGYLAAIRVQATMPTMLGSFITLVGACVFPIGLILVVLAGGELITGNMLIMTVGVFRKKITMRQLLSNFCVITGANLLGALAVAYFFGHIVGMTEGAFLEKTVSIATAKTQDSFMVALISGIGCNIFVALGVWISFGAKDFTGKVLACWFPVMTFVAIGFQHVAANMFVIPAAIFSNGSTITWMQFVGNLVPVFIGNFIGGGIILGGIYSVVYRR